MYKPIRSRDFINSLILSSVLILLQLAIWRYVQLQVQTLEQHLLNGKHEAVDLPGSIYIAPCKLHALKNSCISYIWRLILSWTKALPITWRDTNRCPYHSAHPLVLAGRGIIFFKIVYYMFYIKKKESLFGITQ
jgi:hypothetical protein